MFAQRERLDRVAFAHVYKVGKRIHTPGFVLIFVPSPDRKVAVVVGKKVAQSAVARNMLRRRLYAVLFEADVRTGHSVVIAKPPTRTYPYTKLQTEITTALKRAFGSISYSR